MPKSALVVRDGAGSVTSSIEVPEWFFAVLVDLHRAVDELRAINHTLMRIAERELAQQRASGVREP